MANPFLQYYAGSMAPPVRGPNGTLTAVPNILSVEDIYRGILPPPALPLNPPMPPRPSNSWPGGSDSVGAGAGSYGNLVGLVNDPIYGTKPVAPNSGAVRTANGQAGNTALPPGVVPKSVQTAMQAMAPLPPMTFPPAPGFAGTLNNSKGVDRLQPGTGLAFAGEPAPLPALAAIDAATVPLPRIRPNAPPAPRSSGNSQVASLQQQLASKGFSPGAIDGVPGAKTDAAIRAFQKANGLAADGIVGPKTMAALQGTQAAPTAPLPKVGAPPAPMPRQRPGALTTPPNTLMDAIMSLPGGLLQSAPKILTAIQDPVNHTIGGRTISLDGPTKKAMTSSNKPPPPPGKPAGYGSKGYSTNSARAAMPWAF